MRNYQQLLKHEWVCRHHAHRDYKYSSLFLSYQGRMYIRGHPVLFLEFIIIASWKYHPYKKAVSFMFRNLYSGRHSERICKRRSVKGYWSRIQSEMACCNSDNFQLDCIGISNEDTLSEQRIISNAQILCRVACGVFCRCSQCSRARCHHTLMALCAVLSATATASAAIIWGFVVNVLAEDRVCILFASNKGELIEPLNKNSQICAFSFIGECVVGSFTTALTVWFAIKARCGVGWKAEVWSSLVQLIVLMPLFLIATICATVITAGIQHTCESSIFNNFTSNTSDCAQLYFHGSTYVDSSIRREYIFLNWMLAVMIPAWTGTALLLILLFASMLSIMIHQLKVDRKRYHNDCNCLVIAERGERIYAAVSR